MGLTDYIRLLRRRWVIILVVLLACLAGAAGATVLQTKEYKASTELLVTLSQTGLEADAGSDAFYLPERVQSFATILASPPVVNEAIASAGLPVGTAVEVAASAPPESAVLTVDVVASSPSVAQAVANAYVGVLPNVLTTLNQVTSPTELDFKTLRAAQLPTAPFRPDPLVNGGIGLAAGLILGLAAAVAREAFDRRIRDSRSIEDALDQTLLGVVPLELRKVPLPTNSHPDSLRSEAYRTIRTNLLFAGTGALVPSLAITSPSAGEGKSTLASNLAVVCARSGQRVALVDADLRRPTLNRQFGLSAKIGLSSVLDGGFPLDEALQHAGGHITLLASGPVVRNPSELLGKPMFRQIIEKLEGSHDIVIVDTAPVLPVSDAVLVGVHVGGVVVVGRLRSTTLAGLKRTVDTLTRSRANVLGVVVNGSDEDPDSGYGYAYAALKADDRRARSRRRAHRGSR
ncbi:MAG: polysaccharide biosynthesis tyrosine autokinase [Actinomycetota bacterium]|nr:polysaccharide biosynthesis tyrosine autokinase [Actinomycetota bacterium]